MTCRMSAIEPISELGYASSELRGGWRVPACATSARSNRSPGLPSPSITTAVAPFRTPSVGTICAAVNPMPRNFSFSLASGRNMSAARLEVLTFLFQYRAPRGAGGVSRLA